MAVLIIPMYDLQAKGSANRTSTLDGINYVLKFRENEREGFWYLDVEDTENNPIRSGMKVISNWSLMRLMKGTPRPAGDIITIDTRSFPDDPGIDEFGIDVLLGYIEEGTF